MNYFNFKEVYVDGGKRVLEVNILPEKYCNFDCVFCPVGRSKIKAAAPASFEPIDDSLVTLGQKMEETNADLVFINSKGEGILHGKILQIADFVKSKGALVKLFSNGYLLGRPEYMAIANQFDEVVGELKIITEEAFQKLQRPVDGYTLQEYIDNMSNFKKQYKGIFILEPTIVHGYNDDDASLEKVKAAIATIAPDKLEVARIDDDKFKKKLGLPDDRFKDIKDFLEGNK